MRRPWLTTGLVLSVVGLVALTFGPSPGRLLSRVTAHVPVLDSLPVSAVEMAANVLLFVPVTFLLAAAVPRLSGRAGWLLCTAASVGIEISQLGLPGRQPAVRDVVLNSVGAAAGVLLFRVVDRRRRAGARDRDTPDR